MARQLIFIDDSGDPGFSKTSTSRFVVAAVVIASESDMTLIEAEIIKFRKKKEITPISFEPASIRTLFGVISTTTV